MQDAAREVGGGCVVRHDHRVLVERLTRAGGDRERLALALAEEASQQSRDHVTALEER